MTELLSRLDDWSDRLSPIVVKEIRQMVRGREFNYSFGLSLIAGFLVALAMKGERASEVVGLAQTMRARAVKPSAQFHGVFDTCGTGGDRSGTFNISSCTALVVAACGVRVAKHGNRSVSSLSGSADVFEALGVKVTASPATVERCLAEANIGFFFAPTFHPAMRHAGPARRALGVRTAFNLLGPLTNPAGATRQLVGVPRPEFTELIARALMLLGSERAWVVHGADGIDEMSTTGYTKISECANGEVKTFYLHPTDVGLPKSAAGSLVGGDAAANARAIVRVLEGDHGPARVRTLRHVVRARGHGAPVLEPEISEHLRAPAGSEPPLYAPGAY